MLRNGMAHDLHRSQDVAAAIHSALEGGHGHDGAAVKFHREGPALATLEPKSAVLNGPNAVGMEAFASIAKDGMPHDAIAAVREGAGPGHEHRSDLQLMDKVGAEGLAAVQKDGFPHSEVAAVQHAMNEKLADAGLQGVQADKLDALKAMTQGLEKGESAVFLADKESGTGKVVSSKELDGVEVGGPIKVDVTSVRELAGKNEANNDRAQDRSFDKEQLQASREKDQGKERVQEATMAMSMA
ncbi:hypothetical protein F6X40_11495 [Paraburkholderia sp. UCT31]|uniref:hypothetical protein n=1 Tax=Paraburkholderia sp. UCT31 TaxID=2615209 RepID=UPI001655A396|nr:hypothetical protein [Paraburkholderia sp. UCT31]MBC8737429.1 hypothetical protein [Paraburkholderia sp. UCT31]